METTNAEHYGKKIIAALYLGLLCVSLYFTLYGNSENREISRVRANTLSLVGSIDSYSVDEAKYPMPDEAATEEPIVLNNTYDPTNGITVIGDVYRTKQ